MRNIRSIAVLALAITPFIVVSSPVTKDMVSTAARNWVSRGEPGVRLGSRLGAAVGGVTSHTAEGGAVFYSVKLQGGGTIFMSGDDSLEPVIAFTEDDVDCSSIDKNGPLWALLSGTSQPVPSTGSSSVNRAAANRWAGLLKDGLNYGGNQYVSDLRVDRFVQSTWDQGKVGQKNCYNYYTPNNYVCGCVATAMAQVMRFWCYPTAELSQFSKQCQVDGSNRVFESIAGAFDWANMPLSPSSVSDVQAQAIGKLTYNAGVSVKMNWGSAGSGAMASEIAPAMKGLFGYSSCNWYGSDGILNFDKGKYKSTMLANFDAGCPVLLSIYGPTAGGHQIVGDGYGYLNGALYIHLNMGWSGSKNLWYKVPEMDTDWYNFTVLRAVNYNIFPDRTGNILSGRVVDADDFAREDAVVTVYKAGTDIVVTNGTTGANGIYAFILPGSTSYDVLVEDPDNGAWFRRENVTLGETGGDIPGNSWSDSMKLELPTVRVITDDGAATNLYAYLDAALEAVTTGDRVEVFSGTALRKSVFVAADCTVVSAEEDPSGTPVSVHPGATIKVPDGYVLGLDNLEFTGAAGEIVEVEEGGRLELSGWVSFGLVLPEAAVVSHSIDGLALVGELLCEEKFALKCPVSKLADEPFGSWSGMTFEAATNSAARIVSADAPDTDLGGFATDDWLLKWTVVQCDGPDDPLTAAYFDDADGNYHCYSTIDRALERLEYALDNDLLGDGSQLVFTRDGKFSRGLVLNKDILIDLVAAGSGVTLIPDGDVSFLINCGRIRVYDLKIVNYAGSGLFKVDGRENGSDPALLFAQGTVISNALTKSAYAAPVQVFKGEFEMTDEAAIVDSGYYKASGTVKSTLGGAVFLNGAGCRFNMLGGTISGCSATGSGGGVYAHTGSEMYVKGLSVIDGNVVIKSKTASPSDLYLRSADTLTLTGLLTGTIGIDGVTASGAAFGVADTAGLAETLDSLGHFRNNRNANCSVDFDDTTGDLLWVDTPPPPRTVDPDDPDAAVAVTMDGETLYYVSAADAFESVYTTALVEILGNVYFASDIVITNDVTLMSRDGLAQIELTRCADCSIRVLQGATLAITNQFVSDLGFPFTKPLVYVENSALVLQDGSYIFGACGNNNRAANAVVVWGEEASITMESGSAITDCKNLSNRPQDRDQGSGCGGALLVDRGRAILKGGLINNCRAYRGGVCIASFGSVEISGDIEIDGNNTLDGDNSNLFVHDKCPLYLTGPLTGTVGWTGGVHSDTNLFGEVRADLDYAVLTNSAAHFRNDITAAYGCAMTNAASSKTVLVWSKAISPEGTYTDGEGETYYVVGDIPVAYIEVHPTPIAFQSIVVMPNEAVVTLTNLVRGCWYSIYVTNHLDGAFPAEGAVPLERFQAEADGPYDCHYPIGADDDQLFFGASAADGRIEP